MKKMVMVMVVVITAIMIAGPTMALQPIETPTERALHYFQYKFKKNWNTSLYASSLTYLSTCELMTSPLKGPYNPEEGLKEEETYCYFQGKEYYEKFSFPNITPYLKKK